MGLPRGQNVKRWALLFPLIVLLTAPMPNALNAHQKTLRRAQRYGEGKTLAPDPFNDLLDTPEDTTSKRHDSFFGFVEMFKKLFSGSKGNGDDEPPTTSEQRRSSWQEEERQTEFAFCTDVGFRGLHPEDDGEGTGCWSRCGRVCESAMFLAEDALREWRLVSVATRTKPCKTLAKKSSVQILCKAIKKPTNFDISQAVKQETTFDVEAQQQEQMQKLQQQLLMQQQQLGAAAVGGPLLPGAQAAPESFAAAAAYGRSKSTLPQWAVYLIVIGIALVCLLAMCCCMRCK